MEWYDNSGAMDGSRVRWTVPSRQLTIALGLAGICKPPTPACIRVNRRLFVQPGCFGAYANKHMLFSCHVMAGPLAMSIFAYCARCYGVGVATATGNAISYGEDFGLLSIHGRIGVVLMMWKDEPAMVVHNEFPS